MAGPTEAVDGVADGMTLLFGGFGLCGIPENSIDALLRLGARNLTCVSNNAGVDGRGLGRLLASGQISKMIASYVGENELFERLYLEGRLRVEFNPQGTLAERLRAGGAGIPAFFTPTGVGTPLADGKETREFDGRVHVLERAITGDFSFVRAHRGDHFGNLQFRKTARNFNPLVAAAGRTCVAEVEELVPTGAIDPDDVHLPGVFVKRIYRGPQFSRDVEFRTTRPAE